jgi:predicted site-specific integrase-resolvase
MTMKTGGESWLSLEQASQVLGLPWSTLLRWARAGDPRLPAYRVWDESTPKHGSFRFKEQDVAALQAQT